MRLLVLEVAQVFMEEVTEVEGGKTGSVLPNRGFDLSFQ